MNYYNSNIEWAEPPAIEYRRPALGRTQRFVAVIKTRPGEWAVYKRTPYRVAVSQYVKGYPGTQWSTRQTGPGEYTTYARWVGDQ